METLLKELAAAGYPVASVSDLRTSGRRYVDAVPVLLRWLPEAQTDAETNEIVRALSVPWAREALDPLILLYRSIPIPGTPSSESLRWSVGNAIEVIWDDAHFSELSEIAMDDRFGRARQMVVLGLGRSKRPEATDVLTRLLGDPTVNGHAVMALGRLADPRGRAGLLSMANDHRAWVRKEVDKALRRLEGGA